MLICDQLIGAKGAARAILGLSHAGLVEWTDAADLARLEVIREVRFDAFSLARAEVGLDFVECGFTRCTFRDLKTQGHLWGAGDRWTDCDFENCDLRRMIAPVNSFKRCRFDGVSVMHFKPHQTLFEDCSFSRCTIEGMKAHLISNSQIVNREVEGAGQLVFRNCRFDVIAFHQCFFEGVVFEQCTFANTTAMACNFDGVVSDCTWWSAQKLDPFTVFLAKALDLIRAKCGRDSAAYREFEAYVVDYRSGRTSSQDFSACLYNERVPYLETQKIIKDLRKLVAAFPF